MANKGKQKLISALQSAFNQKQNQPEYLTGALGTYDQTTGAKIIKVPSRPDFVYVRLRGQFNELIEAFNDKVYLQWDLPVLVTRDDLSPNYWRVVSRDVGKYQGWNSSGVPAHGNQHSFSSNTTDGRDVTFIFKRQMAQPLLCRPQDTPNMTVYVEADYYYWGGNFVYFAGGSSTSLAGYKPSSGYVFVTVYLAGATNTIAFQIGTGFSSLSVPTDATVVAMIPEINPALGLPLAAVLLSNATTTINWSSMFDIRIMLFSPSGAIPIMHGLDPADGFHSGLLPATYVSVIDVGNYFTGINAETILQEIGANLLPRGHAIESASNLYPQRRYLRFGGTGILVYDNQADDTTEVQITGVFGSGGSIGTHQLLDATVHTDTLTHTPPVAGDMVYANAISKWTVLTMGPVGTFIKAVAGFPSWEQIVFTDVTGSLGIGQHGILGDGDHSGLLSGNARVAVRKNTGAVVGTRRQLNLIEGAGVGLTLADDSLSEEVDITVNVTGIVDEANLRELMFFYKR